MKALLVAGARLRIRGCVARGPGAAADVRRLPDGSCPATRRRRAPARRPGRGSSARGRARRASGGARVRRALLGGGRLRARALAGASVRGRAAQPRPAASTPQPDALRPAAPARRRPRTRCPSARRLARVVADPAPRPAAGHGDEPAARARRRPGRRRAPGVRGRPTSHRRRRGPVDDLARHGDRGVAAAPANGVGIVGVWPGARALNVAAAATRHHAARTRPRGIARGDHAPAPP